MPPMQQNFCNFNDYVYSYSQWFPFGCINFASGFLVHLMVENGWSFCIHHSSCCVFVILVGDEVGVLSKSINTSVPESGGFIDDYVHCKVVELCSSGTSRKVVVVDSRFKYESCGTFNKQFVVALKDMKILAKSVSDLSLRSRVRCVTVTLYQVFCRSLYVCLFGTLCCGSLATQSYIISTSGALCYR